jgi:CHAT domain-containing protein
MRRAEALRIAMMNLVEDTEYAHPIYWAPFVVVGEGGRVAPKGSI